MANSMVYPKERSQRRRLWLNRDKPQTRKEIRHEAYNRALNFGGQDIDDPPLYLRMPSTSGEFIRRKVQKKIHEDGMKWDEEGKIRFHDGLNLISQKNIIGPPIPQWVVETNKDVSWNPAINK